MKKFQPELVEIEPRLTPSVSSTDLQAAITTTNYAGEQFAWLSQNLNTVGVYKAQSALSQILPKEYFILSGDQAVFNEVLSSFQQQLAANPSQSSFLGPYIDFTKQLIAQAQSEQNYAYALSIRFGASPNVFLPPPPPPPVAPNIVTTIPTVNVGDPGVNVQVVNGSLLRTKDIFVGSGVTVAATDKVRVQYNGWLVSNGTLFDSSALHLDNTQSGDLVYTSQFNLAGGVIQGFTSGIAGMKVGGIRDIYIPAAIGYGATGSPPSIPANADLIFEVKVVSVP